MKNNEELNDTNKKKSPWEEAKAIWAALLTQDSSLDGLLSDIKNVADKLDKEGATVEDFK